MFYLYKKYIKGKCLIFTILGILCIAGAAYFDASQPTWLNEALTSIPALPNQTWDKFFWSVSMMAVYAGASLICGISGSFLGSIASLIHAAMVRQKLYDKVQTFSFSEIDKFSPASLITRLSNDVQKHQINTQMIITMLFRAPVTIGISIYNAFTINGSIIYGFIVIGIVVAMLISVGLIGSRVLPLYTKAQSKLDQTNVVMRENILGARVVKAFNLQKLQHQRYDRENTNLRKLNIKAQALMLPIMSIIMLLINLGVTIILIVAGLMFVNASDHPELNAGIFAFTQIIVIVLFSSIIAIMVIVNSTRTIASIKRINEVFKTRPTIVEKKNPEKLTNNFSVKFDHVSFKYKKDAKQYILKDINFEIKSGQTLGIIGGTGCGKTTVASLLSRFYDPDKGRILIGNVDIKNVASDNLNDNVSAILQDSFLFAGTIESNLKFAKQNATKEDMIEATKNACAFEFIDKLPEKFNSTVEQRGRNFSGGQKQRLSISRTLIKKPKILILDDTTSALDLITEATVQENLRKNYSGTTTVIISQRVSAVKNADLILILDNGKIVANGKHAQLVKTNKLYRDIVSSQLGSRGMEG